jgi:hypothetical protein
MSGNSRRVRQHPCSAAACAGAANLAGSPLPLGRVLFRPERVQGLLFARGMDGGLESGAQGWQEVRFSATRW